MVIACVALIKSICQVKSSKVKDYQTVTELANCLVNILALRLDNFNSSQWPVAIVIFQEFKSSGSSIQTLWCISETVHEGRESHTQLIKWSWLELVSAVMLNTTTREEDGSALFSSC